MPTKVRSVSYEKYGKKQIDVEDIGFTRFQHYSRLNKRYVVVSDYCIVLHFNNKNELVLRDNAFTSYYGLKFSQGLSFYAIGSGVISKYDPNTNRYTTVNVPASAYLGSEVIGIDYYVVMTRDFPPKLEFYDLDGNKVNEIDFSDSEVGNPFTTTWCNSRGDVFFGWSYYDPNKLVIAYLDGSFEVKDISHLSISWLEVVDTSLDGKIVYCVINSEKFGILNVDNLTFETLFSFFLICKENVGVSSNYKYAVVTYMTENYEYKARIIDLENKSYKEVDLIYDGLNAAPGYPSITTDENCLAVFHDFYMSFMGVIIDVKKNNPIDFFFGYLDYPYSFKINEFVV